MNFFEYYPSSNDPDWLTTILARFRDAGHDVGGTEQFVGGYYSRDQLTTLDNILLNYTPPLESRICLHSDTSNRDVPILPISPHDPQFQSISTVEMDKSHSIIHTPIALPNIPSVRITPQSIDVQRNSLVQFANGTVIYTYDQPPTMQGNTQALTEQVTFLTSTLMSFVHQRESQIHRQPTERIVFISPNQEVTMTSPPASPRLALAAYRSPSYRSYNS